MLQMAYIRIYYALVRYDMTTLIHYSAGEADLKQAQFFTNLVTVPLT